MDAETKGLVERLRDNAWGLNVADTLGKRDADRAEAAATIIRLTAERDEALAEVRGLQEALVQHNDRLRSAQQVASRDGADTNWLSFRGAITYTLAEYHELSNKARAALTQEATDGQS